jgi:hypothetical protein
MISNGCPIDFQSTSNRFPIDFQRWLAEGGLAGNQATTVAFGLASTTCWGGFWARAPARTNGL